MSHTIWSLKSALQLLYAAKYEICHTQCKAKSGLCHTEYEVLSHTIRSLKSPLQSQHTANMKHVTYNMQQNMSYVAQNMRLCRTQFGL